MNTPGSLPVRGVACVHRKLRLIRAHNRFMVRRRNIEEELSFTYHGMAVNDGTMDMTDFGNALIGYAQAIRATVTELDPNAGVIKSHGVVPNSAAICSISSNLQSVSPRQRQPNAVRFILRARARSDAEKLKRPQIARMLTVAISVNESSLCTVCGNVIVIRISPTRKM